MMGLLQLEDVVVNFDGFRALNGLNFFVRSHELRFVIGPNGAGKTTLLDIICGKVAPSSGYVYYDEELLVRPKPYELSRRGIGRKFQAASVFLELSVRENMEIAVPRNREFFRSVFHSVDEEDDARIEETLAFVGLRERAGVAAAHLSHGERQWLEIAMVMLQDPKLFLMDEPVAGMTSAEREKTGELIHDLAGRGCAIIVVEHDMKFVKEYSRTISVLHEGALLCEGDFAAVSEDDAVRRVYLGR